MSDTSNNTNDGDEILENGEVPADADLNPDGGDVAAMLPGGSRLDEGEDDGLNKEEVRPDGTALP